MPRVSHFLRYTFAMSVPFSIRLAFFTVALLVLSFILKAFCPIEEGCLTDPFVSFFLEPLFFLENSGRAFLDVQYEVLFLLCFWFLVGALLGSILDLAQPKKVS